MLPAGLVAGAIIWAWAGPAVAQTAVPEGPVITVTAPRTVTDHVRRNDRTSEGPAVISLQLAIRYADLDLALPAHAARLMVRVEGAARDACHHLDRMYPLDPDKRCVERAIADATPRAQAVIDAAIAGKPSS